MSATDRISVIHLDGVLAVAWPPGASLPRVCGWGHTGESNTAHTFTFGRQ